MDILSEQLNEQQTPLGLRCAACGAEATYDPVSQSYHCLFCGATTPLEQPIRQAEAWQERQRSRIRSLLWEAAPALYRCSGCGAALLSPGAREGTCPFCGGEMERGGLSREEDIAPLMLPFVLTPEEARARLKSWTARNPLLREARRTAKALDTLRPIYLPCRLVQGPVSFQVTRSGCGRSYSCRDQVRDALVNCSAQMDSLLLSAVEPFDFSTARALRPEDLFQGELKLRDIPEPMLTRRIDEELVTRRLGAVERALHADELLLQPNAADARCLDLLVPVYLLTAGGTRVLLNGQSGRIAVTRDKPSPSRVQVLEPLSLSLLAALLWIYAAAGNLELFVLGALASTVLIFVLLSGRWGRQLHRRIFGLGNPRTELWEARLLLDGPLPTPQGRDTPPVFFEELDGACVPVEIHRLDGPRRGLVFSGALATLVLPYVLACLIVLLRRLFGAQISLYQIVPAYGAGWYVVSTVTMLLLWLSLGRGLLFDHPLPWRLEPDGRKTPIPRDKVTAGHMPLLQRLRALLKADALAAVALGLLVLLLGSVYAMLPH